MASANRSNVEYEREVSRLRSAGVAGQSGRLRELFDYLAERGPEAEPATQAEIAAAVFRQSETDADDATVRVYIHRLRKKLEDHYRDLSATERQALLEIPSGIYALRLAEEAAAPAVVAHVDDTVSVTARHSAFVLAGLLTLVAVIFVLGSWWGSRVTVANSIWQPVLESERPLLIVLGDYYLFGEIDPVFPEEGRLIRDFRVDSPEDLLRMQEAEPERYGMAEDFGLNYLPFQSAYALQRIAPIFASRGKEVEILPASQLTTDMLNTHDVVYLGLLSGMGLLEDITFADSSLRIGSSYDEVIDRESGERWVSDEARRLAAPVFYRDFAYVARFDAPGGALVTIVASERVTGLRGIGSIVTDPDLSGDLDDVTGNSFEALFQITGQQGADLSDRLILAKPRE